MRRECGKCIYGKPLRAEDVANPKYNQPNFEVGKIYCDLRRDIHKAGTDQRNCRDFERRK